MSVESVVVPGRIKIPYQWAAGPVSSRFLTSLRDKGEFWGMRCAACRKVNVPPQSRCPFCDGVCAAWQQVGPQGVLETWTQTADRTFGIIRLNNADTGLVHWVSEYDVLRPGLRMEPVFSTERKGHILDIHHFRPVK